MIFGNPDIFILKKKKLFDHVVQLVTHSLN